MTDSTRLDAFARLTVFDLAGAAWNKRFSVVVVFVLLSGTFIAGLMMLPNRYISKAQLLVRLGPGSVAIDPTAGLSQTVSLQESRLAQVNSIVELLRSKEMTERVAGAVGPKRLLETSGPIGHLTSWATGWIPKSAPKPEAGFSASEIEGMLEIAEACVAIEDDVEIFPAQNAYTISVEFVANSPFLARDVVDAYVQEYPKYHKAAYETTGSVAFFEKESREAFRVATELQEQVRQLKSANGIIELDSSKAALRDELNVVQKEQNQVESDLSSVRAELAQLDEQMKTMPSTIESEKVTGLYKRSGDLVRQRLYELEIVAQDLASRYKPDHPRRVAMAAQLEAAKETAMSEIGQEPQMREVINPNLQTLDLAYRTAVARRAGLEAKRDALDTQLERIDKQLTELNEIGTELVKLTWDASVAESNYLQTAGRLANARQISALNEQLVSDVSVAQEATLELKKVGPKRGILAIAAMVFAAVVALAQAAFRGLTPRFSGFGGQRGNLSWPSPAPAGHLSNQRNGLSREGGGSGEPTNETANSSPNRPRAQPIAVDATKFFDSRKSESISSGGLTSHDPTPDDSPATRPR